MKSMDTVFKVLNPAPRALGPGNGSGRKYGLRRPTGVETAYRRAMNSFRGFLDAYIAGRLVAAYSLSEHLGPFTLGVEVKNRTVTLTGAVDDKVLRDLAIEIAHGVDEVRGVKSEIWIQAPAPRKSQNNAEYKFLRQFMDASTTARVKSRLFWNGNTHGLAIHVETRDDDVTLSGTVRSSAESELAEQIARHTKDVERVENRLQIVAPATIPDAPVETGETAGG